MGAPRLAMDVPGEIGDPSLFTLVEAIEQLSSARSVEDVAAVVRSAARRISGADGVTFVLRDGGQCYYLDEDAIEPLWKGLRFPLTACISGWAMLNGRTAVIPDIYADDRIPHDAYRSTFVKSLVMTPVRADDPIAAIGAYWATVRHPSPDEVAKLQVIARATATALENVRLIDSLNESLQRRDSLIRELDHRVKNTLAAVRSIAHQTLRSAKSPESFNEALMGRIMALSRGHELLAREAHAEARLRDVLEQATAPYARPGGGRLTFEGPDVRLSAETAVNFQMAFHELATNAVRHGALSTPAGKVAITWSADRVADPARLQLCWRESGGPVVTPLAEKGFGVRLIERSLAASVGGTSSLAFEPDGLVFQLSAPISAAIALP